MKEVVIVSAVRTPIGTMGGGLARFRQRDLASIVIKAVLDRANVAPELVEDVFFGCCNNVQEDVNVARVGLLEAGLPDTVPGVTINRVCLSGMEAIASAVRKIQCGGKRNLCCRWGGDHEQRSLLRKVRPLGGQTSAPGTHRFHVGGLARRWPGSHGHHC